jgi:large subunit ribosomal protein L18
MSVAERTRRRKLRHRKLAHQSPRLRLSVFRSCKYIYAQVIDDVQGRTLVQLGSKALAVSGSKVEAARALGLAIAEAALAKGIKQVVFDRGAYAYHGRVKALAEAAREGGLDF